MKNHRVVAPIQDTFASGFGLHELDEFRRIPFRRVRRRIDKDPARELEAQKQHLLDPRRADVPAHDNELGEIQQNLFQVGDGFPGTRRPQRTGLADLQAERDLEADALGVDGIEQSVGGVPVKEESRSIPGEDARSSPQGLCDDGTSRHQCDADSRTDRV